LVPFFAPAFFSVVADVPVAGAVVVDVPVVDVRPVPLVPVVFVAAVSVAVIVPVVPVIVVSVVAVLPVAIVSVAVVIDVSVAAVSVFVFCSLLQLMANSPTTNTATMVRTSDFFITENSPVQFARTRGKAGVLGWDVSGVRHSRRRNIQKLRRDVKLLAFDSAETYRHPGDVHGRLI
jgi:hypothetical protein